MVSWPSGNRIDPSYLSYIETIYGIGFPSLMKDYLLISCRGRVEGGLR